MFKNEFQGGPYFEVFSTQGKDSTAGWKMPSSGCKKVYDKEVKGYIYVLEGTSATTKIHLPKDSRTSCTLVQHFLILQINIFMGKEFSVELGVSDLGNNKRRILLSTSQKEINLTPLHAKIPLTIVRRNVWVNLCLDMLSLVSDTWKGQTYRAIEGITVSANCKIKRIFTMKVQPPDTTDDDELYGCPDVNTDELESIPKQCQLSSDINQVTQVLTINKIRYSEKLKGDSARTSSTLDLSNLDISGSGRKLSSSGKDGKHHIAFGSKVPVPEHPRRITQLGNATSRSFRSLSSRNDEVFNGDFVTSSMASQDGLNSMRSTQSAACHPPVTSRPVHNVDTARVDEDTSHALQDHIVAPHPPNRPSSDQPRRRPRVKASTIHRDRQSSAGRDDQVSETVSPNSHVYSRTVSLNSAAPDAVHKSSSDGPLTNRSGAGQVPHHRKMRDFPTLQGSGLPQTSNRLRSSKEMGVGPDVPEIQRSQNVPVEDSVTDVIGLLNNKTAGRGSSSSDDETSQPGEYEDSDEEEPSSQNQLHVFASRPTKAPLRIRSPGTAVLDTGQKKTTTTVKATRMHARGAQPENDFWSSSEEDEMHSKGWKSSSRPHSGTSSNGTSPKTNFKSGSHSRVRSGSQSRGGSGNQSRGGSGNQSRGGSGNQSRGGSGNQGRGRSGDQGRVGSGDQNRGGSGDKGRVGAGDQGREGYVIQSRGGIGNQGRGDADSQGREILDVAKPKITMSAPKPSSISPEHKQFNPALYTSDSPNRAHPASIVSMSRKSVREIPKSDARLSQALSSERPYDFTRYQMVDVTESFEERMLLSMQRQDEAPSPESPRKDVHLLHTSPRRPRPLDPLNPHLHSESPATTSDDDTSFSTWKAPAPNQIHHNYQDEMKCRLSSDTLTSSNPRDWSGGIFSPPINLPNVGDLQNTATSEDLSETHCSPRKHASDSHPDVIKYTDSNEEELNLFFDSSLNCYYDPKTHKYYELAS